MIDPELPEQAQTVDERTLRQFAALCLVLFGAAAGWHLSRGHAGRALLFGGIALGVGPLGLLAPNAIRFLYSTLLVITRPIGAVVTRLVLGALFYGLFTPVAQLFRFLGRDPLGRRPDASRATYWKSRPDTTDVRRYLRQF